MRISLKLENRSAQRYLSRFMIRFADDESGDFYRSTTKSRHDGQFDLGSDFLKVMSSRCRNNIGLKCDFCNNKCDNVSSLSRDEGGIFSR